MGKKKSESFADFRTNGFMPNPAAPVDLEFARLAKLMKWKPGTKAYKRHRQRIMLSGGHAQSEANINLSGNDMLKLAAKAYNQRNRQPKTARPQNEVPVSWFDHFQKAGFKHNTGAGFEDEFTRLAKVMKWTSPATCRSMAEEAYSYYADHQEYPKLNTLTGYMPPHASFVYDPINTFEVEFHRLATGAHLKKGDSKYEERLRAASARDEKIRSVDLTKLALFKHYGKLLNFKLNPNSHIDVQFWRLIEHGEWGEKKSLSRWGGLLAEAMLLADRETDKQSQPSTKSKTSSVSGQSQASGVKLNAQSLSESQTTDFTPTHSEYTPAPSTSSYFSSFAGRGFTPEPSEPLEDEFERLSIHEGWAPGDPERVKQWRLALEGELEAQFGASDKLASWQALCTELGIKSPPTSITQCKKALKTKHVSIKSLVNARREMIRQGKMEILDIGVQLPSFITTNAMAQMAVVPKTTVKVFGTVKELRAYCKKHKMFFPRVEAKSDGFLKALLRHLTSQR